MWIWVTTVAQRQAATSEMLLRNVLQPPFASVFLLQRRRAKQQDWEVSIEVKITVFLPWSSWCLLDHELPWGEQRELLSAAGISRELKPCLLQTWMCHIKSSFQTQVRIDCRGTQWQNLLPILISWLDLCKSEDDDSERHHHKSVSLFCCIFFNKAQSLTYPINSISHVTMWIS